MPCFRERSHRFGPGQRARRKAIERLAGRPPIHWLASQTQAASRANAGAVSRCGWTGLQPIHGEPTRSRQDRWMTASGKYPSGQPRVVINRGQSKPAPGSALRPAATCSCPATSRQRSAPANACNTSHRLRYWAGSKTPPSSPSSSMPTE